MESERRDVPRTVSGNGDRKFRFRVVVAITVLAAVIRFYKLGEWSFWNDESHTVDVAIHGIRSDAVGQSLYYPLNFLLTQLSFRLFGVSEFSARLFPCVFGILTVPVTYRLGKTLSGWRTGLAAAFFLALSTWHIDWSQNARYYAILGFLVTLSAVLLFEGFEQGKKWKLLAVHPILLLAVLSHPSGAFAGAAFVAYLILLYIFRVDKPDYFNKSILFYLSPYIVALIVFLPWYIRLPRMLLELRGAVSSPIYLLMNLAYHINPVIIVLAAAALVLMLADRRREGVFLLCVICVPILLLLAASLKTLAYGVYVFYTLPAFYLLAADSLLGLYDIGGTSKKILVHGVFAAVVLTLVSSTYLYFAYENGNRAKWREACMEVKERMGGGDVVFATEGTTAFYYLGNSPNVYWLSQFQDKYLSMQNKTLWFIVYDEERTRESTREFLRDRCRFIAEFSVHSSVKSRELRIYRHDPPGREASLRPGGSRPRETVPG